MTTLMKNQEIWLCEKNCRKCLASLWALWQKDQTPNSQLPLRSSANHAYIPRDCEKGNPVTAPGVGDNVPPGGSLFWVDNPNQ